MIVICVRLLLRKILVSFPIALMNFNVFHLLVVPVDILLKFNLINQLLENESINNVIDVFKQYQFENVRFIAEKQSFQRINAFVYDKSGYMKSMMDSIVHVSRLPSTVSATMVDLIKWISNLFDNGENGFYGINVCKRSKENENSIRSALIGRFFLTIF